MDYLTFMVLVIVGAIPVGALLAWIEARIDFAYDGFGWWYAHLVVGILVWDFVFRSLKLYGDWTWLIG